MGLFENLGKQGGSALGKALFGKQGAKIGKNLGKNLGKAVSGVVAKETGLSFATGGRVKAKKGKAVKATVHGGEFILPIGVAPTKAQKSAVAKRKAKARAKK